MTATSRWTFVLAVGATGTALSLSILAGWQRGGSLPERSVWVAIGTVLVTSAHLLPALLRDAPILVRGTGCLLWGACLATACYGHADFFVTAQQHAGELRASTVPDVVIATSGRSLTAVMADRANVARQLALVGAQRCPRDCPGWEARRTTLAARLEALNAEADDIRRRQSADDRVTAQRDTLLADPVTSRLATLLGTTVVRVDLLSGLAFAAVLEGVACLLWRVSLRSSSSAPVPVVPKSDIAPVTDSVDVTQPVVTTVAEVSRAIQSRVTPVIPSHAPLTVSREAETASHDGITNSHASRDGPVPPAPVVESVGDAVSQSPKTSPRVGSVRPSPTFAAIWVVPRHARPRCAARSPNAALRHKRRASRPAYSFSTTHNTERYGRAPRSRQHHQSCQPMRRSRRPRTHRAWTTGYRRVSRADNRSKTSSIIARSAVLSRERSRFR